MTRDQVERTVADVEQASPQVLPVRDRQFSRLKRQAQSQVFTKFADVKSRIGWTAERQRLLRKMWDRGDKVAVIAAALGCKVGAVNVARARFGLKPRRIVSGRPKLVDDEPVHKIERVAFTTSPDGILHRERIGRADRPRIRQVAARCHHLKAKIEKLMKEKPDITWHRAIRLIVDPVARNNNIITRTESSPS